MRLHKGLFMSYLGGYLGSYLRISEVRGYFTMFVGLHKRLFWGYFTI
jgi:hypothetical protein